MKFVFCQGKTANVKHSVITGIRFSLKAFLFADFCLLFGYLFQVLKEVSGLAPKSWDRVYVITGHQPGDTAWVNSVSVPEVNNFLQFSLKIKVRKSVHT